MTEVCLLDVGHGNGTLFVSGGDAVVVDAPRNATMLEALGHFGISRLRGIIASHSDSDHVGGLINLMSSNSITLDVVYVNPDADKTSASWRDFRFALRDARQRSGTKHSAITTDVGTLQLGSLSVDVVAPTPELFLASSGGTDLEGRRVRANTMSVVLRVREGELGIAVLPGDLDATGLENLLAEGHDLRARTLVFPHHGGRPASGSAEDFAKKLCQAVEPDVVYFSIGRGRHSTPRPEIVGAILEGRPNVHIACSQLSTWCASSNPAVERGHLEPLPARGKYSNTCCAGSLSVFDEGSLSAVLSGHATFVDLHAPTALCRVRNN
jgi:competence protein ComEC